MLHGADSAPISIIHVAGNNDVHIMVFLIVKDERVLFAVGLSEPSYYVQVTQPDTDMIVEEVTSVT